MMAIISNTPLMQLKVAASNCCRQFHGKFQHAQGSF